jgi:hypothetical protein
MGLTHVQFENFQFERALVQNPLSGDLEPATYRISKRLPIVGS